MSRWSRCLAVGLILAVLGGAPASAVRGHDVRADEAAVFSVDNESGRAATINVAGFPVVARDNPFFRDLGVNGRRCVTCHQPSNNMTVTPGGLQARFEATDGTDPIFRANDGSNSPLADVSTVRARRRAYSMLLTKGLIRVGIAVPADAEFVLDAVRDPYGYAGHNGNGDELSLFRRPLPATNLAFLSAVMWDGRETVEKGSVAAIHFDLAKQSNDATQGHAQAPEPIDQATREQIVAYEMGNFSVRSSIGPPAACTAPALRAAREHWPRGRSRSARTTRSAAIRAARGAIRRRLGSTRSCSRNTTRGVACGLAASTARGRRSSGGRLSSTRVRSRSPACRESTTTSA